jgi:hypothetical protein
VNFPRLLLVHQKFPDRRLANVAEEVRRQLSASPIAARLKPGARIAIGVGSRGIGNIAAIVRETATWFRERGTQPFLFPAMGSHGAATAAGQAQVLAKYGITEAEMGCPVVSQLEVVSLGKTAGGIEAFLDKAAYDSDGIMLIGRVKWHTDFAGKVESGLFKMMAIGLGKFAGARRYHTYAYKLGLERVILSVGRQVLASGKIVGGLAILEDENHNTALIDAVPVEEMERREERNLALVKTWMPRLPANLDLLIMDEIGKDISGSGMDTRIVNRGVYGQYNPWPDTPTVERIFVRGISPLSYHSAVGVGLADIVPQRLVDQIDWTPTAINCLTSNTLACARTPVHFATDRECLERIWPTVGKLDPDTVTYGWIRNTMEMARLGVSENLRACVEANPLLEIVKGPRALEFDGEGNLVSPFARETAAIQ